MVKVELEGCKLIDSSFESRDGRSWNALTLIEASKELEIFEMPLACIDIGVSAWSGVTTMKGFAEHAKRIQDTDLQYPILLNDEGYCCDGWHRIIKAILEGRETIKAKRFVKMPDCDRYNKPTEDK